MYNNFAKILAKSLTFIEHRSRLSLNVLICHLPLFEFDANAYIVDYSDEKLLKTLRFLRFFLIFAAFFFKS